MTLFFVLCQTIVSFVVLLLLTRLLGKQQISQLTYYEYLNGITIGSIAANMATDELYNVAEHFVGLVVYGLLTLLVSYSVMKNRRWRKAVTGEPVIVVQDGSILEDNLRKMHMDVDEFTMLLRSKGVFDYKELELAIIEQSGQLSILPKPDYQPVTNSSLRSKGKEQSKGLAVEVIVDGQIIYQNLECMDLDGKWLMEQLRQRKIQGISQVFLATVNKQHKLQVDLYDDQIEGMLDMSDGGATPLSLDRLSTTDPEAPSMNIP